MNISTYDFDEILTEVEMEQFLDCLKSPVWDGNIISKEARDVLVAYGLLQQTDGFTWPTPKGIKFAVKFTLIES